MKADPLEDVLAKDPGDAFEEIFWNLLRRRYRPEGLVYIPTMGGDHGIEGFSTDGIAYQYYADRDSLTLRNRTDKQKKKLYEDTVKLKEHKDKLAKVLGDVVLGHYFLCVPGTSGVPIAAIASRRPAATLRE